MAVKDLELGFNKLSDNNIQLRKEKRELGNQLGVRTAEKAAVEKELEKMKSDCNITEFGLKQKYVSTPTVQRRGRVHRQEVTKPFACRKPARKGFSSRRGAR